MRKNTGIQIKKVKLTERKISADFKKVFIALGKSAIMYSIGHYPNAAKEAISVVGAFGLKADLADLAYELTTISFIQSCLDLIEENTGRIKPPVKIVEDLQANVRFAQFVDSLEEKIGKKDYYLDQKTLQNPRTLALFQDLQGFFGEWLEIFGLGKEVIENIADRLPAYFVFNIYNEYRKDEKYHQLTANLDNAISKALRREISWDNYLSYLEKQVDEPVFDEDFSLRQIFIPLRAYYNIKFEAGETGQQDFQRIDKRPLFLLEEMNEWVKTTDTKNAIKIISGGPGSGKSSFVKIWAAELASKNHFKLLFIPLYIFTLHENLTEAVNQFLSKEDHFEHNLFDHVRESKLLIIFDGLDELSERSTINETITRDFMYDVRNICRFYNKRKLNLRILITGRELAVQNIHANFSQDIEILHLLPYYLTGEEQAGFSKNKILDRDYRNDWWSRYGKLTGHVYKSMPNEIKLKALDEITAQPLLNYLIALSLKRNKIQFTANINTNEVYLDLIKSVHERAYSEKHKQIEGLPFDDFVQILEEIGIAAWHGGDIKTTTVKKIQEHLERSNLNTVFDVFHKNKNSGIARLLSSFYFRQANKNGSGEKTFEFTHKIFGEYLAARRLVRLAKEIHKEFIIKKEKIPDYVNALQSWIINTGPTAITENLRNFIVDEIKLLNKENYLEEIQHTFIELISYVLKNGLPFSENKKHMEERRLSRNAETSLLIVLNACAIQTKTVSKIKWPEKYSFTEYKSRLLPARRNGEKVVVFECFSYLDISNQFMPVADFFSADLRHSNLRNTTLIFANLSFSDLRNASLGHVNLSDATLSNTKLENTDLSYSNLINARFSYENLVSAKTLYKCIGIPERLKKDLEANHPHLFEPPSQYFPE